MITIGPLLMKGLQPKEEVIFYSIKGCTAEVAPSLDLKRCLIFLEVLDEGGE